MNQTRLIAVGILVVGLILVCLGVYVALKPAERPQAANANSNANFSATSTPGSAGKKSVTVPATAEWFDTGIDVTGKVRINFLSGHWRNSPTSGYGDGEGRGPFAQQAKLLVPSAPLGSLVAKVAGKTFKVGNSFDGVLGSGRLYLAINDIPETYNDNDGALTVSIDR
jgi:hypothetical protein